MNIHFGSMKSLVVSASLIALFINVVAMGDEGATKWSVSFQSSPIMLYSCENTPLVIVIDNPKTSSKGLLLRIDYTDLQGAYIERSVQGITAIPGKSNMVIYADQYSSALLKSRNCIMARISIEHRYKKELAHSKVPVDFDLTNIIDAAPVQGSSPLEVIFSCAPTGGEPPYTISWNFGNGDSSNNQSGSTLYYSEGTYIAICVITDSKQGLCISKQRVIVEPR
jgi:hypothetical protein